MKLRWAVLTTSGMNARIYAENRLEVARILAAHGLKLACAMAAGCWHEFFKLDRPAWDGTESQGYPGGKSGRPGH